MVENTLYYQKRIQIQIAWKERILYIEILEEQNETKNRNNEPKILTRFSKKFHEKVMDIFILLDIVVIMKEIKKFTIYLIILILK